jgi:hypothetical protein
MRLPSRIALLLGLGALSVSAAQANTAEVNGGNGPLRVPQQSAKSFGDLLIWNDGGRIYVSEPGKEAEELRFGDTAEARHLKQLLEHDGAAADAPRALPHRLILVGSGGDGFHWDRSRQPDSSDKTGNPTTTRGSDRVVPPAQTGIPGKTDLIGVKDNK